MYKRQEGLEEVFKEYSYKFHGIVNGIDNEKYNPMTDEALFKNYDVNAFKLKRYNKEEVQNYYGLKKDGDKPLVLSLIHISLFLEEVPTEPKNTIVIVNKEEYEKAKKNEEKENWPHVEGLVYDKETKIAIKEIIDDFTK